MTEERFSELVNLYLDEEISAGELELLKDEIAADTERKQAFAERCRLHQAMRLALSPERSRRRAPSSGSAAPVRPVRGAATARAMGHFSHFSHWSRWSRWWLGSGLAASVLVAMMLWPPASQKTTSPAQLAGVSEAEGLIEDPLDRIGQAEWRRFANTRQGGAYDHASLVSHMRLMGLRPELTPEEKQLQEISLAAAMRPERSMSQAELFQRIQELRAIPEPKLLEIEEAPVTTSWPGAFRSSLVRFGN